VKVTVSNPDPENLERAKRKEKHSQKILMHKKYLKAGKLSTVQMCTGIYATLFSLKVDVSFILGEKFFLTVYPSLDPPGSALMFNLDPDPHSLCIWIHIKSMQIRNTGEGCRYRWLRSII
jgi:hypothetical protein